MSAWRRKSTSEQFTEFMRKQIAMGKWRKTMPGAMAIATQFQISRRFVDQSLQILESEGVIASQGRGKPRAICNQNISRKKSAPKICLILHTPEDLDWTFFFRLRHQLCLAGAEVEVAPEFLIKLNQSPDRVASLIEKVNADAWVTIAASRVILEKFIDLGQEIFAVGSQGFGLPVPAGWVDVQPSYNKLIRQLNEIGRKKIVIIEKRINQTGEISKSARDLIGEIQKIGDTVSRYNLPIWDDTPEGLRKLLDEMFKFSPPDAIIAATPQIVLGVLTYLTWKGIKVPDNLSLVSTGYYADFKWISPSVSHLYWSEEELSKQVISWFRKFARGTHSKTQNGIPTKFMAGETFYPRTEVDPGIRARS